MRNGLLAILLCVLLAPWRAAAFETGANDFRVSDMGPDGDTKFGALRPAVAYNARDHEYLVVWMGTDDRGDQVEEETEIFRQRIDAATGQGVGANDRRITAMGGLGDPDDGAVSPAVAYNSDAHEYLVVWEGRLDGVRSGIFGQRLDASTGQPRGASDFLISDGSRAWGPDVAYHPTQREYLVAWASDGVAPLVPGELEIFVRRVDGATGQPLGPAARRVSTMGRPGATSFFAGSPAVAVDPINDRYLVVWEGNDDRTDDPSKLEIYGQLLDAVTGLEVGLDDARLSFTGDDADAGQWATSPDVAFDPTVGDAGEYLVVFSVDLLSPGSDPEIYGQRVEPILGLRAGTVDLPISEPSHSRGSDHHSKGPAVTARPGGGYLVVWLGGDSNLAQGEWEVFGRFVGRELELDSDRLRLSDMGGTGDRGFISLSPDVGGDGHGGYLVAWEGEDDVPPLVEGEREIFGQLLTTRLLADGFESGDLSAWSVTP